MGYGCFTINDLVGAFLLGVLAIGAFQLAVWALFERRPR